MKKKTFQNPVLLFIASVILVACNNSADIDITERFLMDIGFTTEINLIEKQRKAAWQKIDITNEEREEIVNLIDQTILESKSAFKNKIDELYSKDKLTGAMKDKKSSHYEEIKNNLIEISETKTEELNGTLDNGISDIRYRYGFCLQ